MPAIRRWAPPKSPVRELAQSRNATAMSARLDPSWRVLASPSTPAVDRCVDIFARPDGTFGFEEFRRDPEDMGRRTPVGYYFHREFTTEADTLAAAGQAVRWLTGILDDPNQSNDHGPAGGDAR